MIFKNKNVHYPPRLLEAFRPGVFVKESRQSNKHNQSGRSMIEMLGVLAIVGVLSAGGIAGYSMAMQSYKTNELIEKMHVIQTRVRTLYKNGNYTGLSNTTIINSGKLKAKDLENPFGGNLYVARSGFGSDSFHIDAQNIPSEACVAIVQSYWGDIDSLVHIHIRGSKGQVGFHYDGARHADAMTYYDYPAAATDAINACNANDLKVYVVLY